jgi:hypothetical protein
MPRKTERPLSDDDKQLLRKLTRRLLRLHTPKGKDINRNEAIAWVKVLRRIVSPKIPRHTAAQSQEQAIALAYHTEQQLRGGGRNNGARAAVAKRNRNKITVDQVSTLGSDWKKEALGRIERLTAGLPANDRSKVLKNHLRKLKTR